ncbi:hypothetical protein SESBI_38253 [Sesbania bispinosa]|nr:hypothetical protein SESBI_38253 [Sesbania bispinosa]
MMRVGVFVAFTLLALDIAHFLGHPKSSEQSVFVESLRFVWDLFHPNLGGGVSFRVDVKTSFSLGFHIFIYRVSLSRVAVLDLCYQWDAWGAFASEQRGKVTYHPEGYSRETRGGGRHLSCSR